MEMWNKIERKMVKTPSKQAKFLKDIDRLSKKYNLSISHEDGHGAFVIEEYREYNIKWMQNAIINW